MYVQLKNNVSFRKTFQAVVTRNIWESVRVRNQFRNSHFAYHTHACSSSALLTMSNRILFFTLIYKHKINSEKIEENKLRLTLIFSCLSDHFSCKGQRQRIRFSAWLHASTFFFHHNTKLHRVLQCM